MAVVSLSAIGTPLTHVSAAEVVQGTDNEYISEEIITFDSTSCDFEMGVDKLIACGHESSFIDTMPEDVVKQISTSTEAINKTSYYKEVILDNENKEEAAEVVRISNDEFEYRTAHGDDWIESQNDSGVSTFATTENIDSGTLKVTTTLYSVSGGQLSQYMIVSSFVWTTMPKYRGTDFFCITRDSNTSVIPNSFGSTVTYYQQKYIFIANVGGVSSTKSGDPTTVTTSYENEASNPLDGFAAKFLVPIDNIPVNMLAGTSAGGYVRYGLQGGCWYQGVLKQPTIVPQNFNHWSTYCHQKSTTWFSSPSVSVPLGISVTVSPEASYSTSVIDTILATWSKK